MHTRSSLVEVVASELRNMILTGRLRPGEFLPPQRVLASRFGVGSSTIREAVQTLVAVGLLQSRAGKGTWVCEDAILGMSISQAVKGLLGELNAQSLYEARALIEVALTESAAERASAADIRRIRSALKAMRETGHDLDAFVQADLEFHAAVAEAGHNDLLAQFYQLSRALLLEATHELVAHPSVVDTSIDIQAAILQAIEQGDPGQARRAAENHMRYIYGLLEQYGQAGAPSAKEVEAGSVSHRSPTIGGPAA